MKWVDSIKNYIPCNEQEKSDKEIIIKAINEFDDILARDNEVIHITSSAFVVNKNRDKVLMVHHNIYNSWSWTGGHADGEENLLLVAMNELKEETGVKSISAVSKKIYSLDILPVFGHIKKGVYISSHLHISVAYLIEVDENEVLVVKPDENSDVKWIPIDEIDLYSKEPHMKKIYEKIVLKIRA
jgi:ADP-ribose pyrophosphatase YjhB (NUDIX family)